MAESMVFVLLGSDRLSPVLRGAGDSAGRLNRRLNDVGDSGGTALARVGAAGLSAATGVAKISAVAGAAIPVVAGLSAALVEILPAAGVAATGVVAVGLAAGALKIGMQGVGDAVKAAMDPSDPEAFAEALKKLSPSARGFAKEVRSLQPELRKVQQAVQERLFQGLDDVLKRMSTTTLPVLRNGLVNAGGALNLMAKNVGNVAVGLSKSGALGQAISGANVGLFNLSRVPSILVQGLVQVGAAAAPAFGRLTASAGSAFDNLSEKMTKAFESGAMQRAIEQAISLIGDLAEIAGNVFATIGSIFSAAQVSGGGFIGTLQQITGALREAFASPQVQAGLRAIFQTMSVLAQTAAPLLISALKTVAPVFEALGPPVQILIKALGDALGPIIKALGPVLLSAAKAVGALLTAVAPLLPVIGTLVASLLPAVTPLFDALQVVFEALAPVIADVGQILQQTLAPVIAALVPVVEVLAKAIGGQLVFFVGLLGDLFVELGPSMVQIGTSFGELLIAVAPLIETMAALNAELLKDLMPFITPMIKLIGELAAIFADKLAAVITEVVIPALNQLTAFFGTVKEKMQPLIDVSQKVADFVVKIFQKLFDVLVGNSIIPDLINRIVFFFASLPGRAFNALGTLAGKITGRAFEAGRRMVAAIRQKIDQAVRFVRGLPGRAFSALAALGGRMASRARGAGNSLVSAIRGKLNSAVRTIRALPGRAGRALARVGATLRSAGRRLIQGFINGIKSMAGAVARAVSGVLSKARNLLPFSPAKEGPFSGRGWTLFAGRSLIEGLAAGIGQRRDQVARAMAAVADTAAAGVPTDLDAAVSVRGLAAARGQGAAQITFNVSGAVDPVSVAQQIRRMLLELKRSQGVNIQLGVG